MPRKKVTHKRGEYKTYKFRTYDPAMEEVLSFANRGGGKATSIAAISRESGVSTSTLHNWRKRKTKRPQNASVEATGRALGKKRVWVNM